MENQEVEKRKVYIVAEGDPNRPDFSYTRTLVEIHKAFMEAGGEVHLVLNEEEATEVLLKEKNGGVLFFLSSYYRHRAQELAKKLQHSHITVGCCSTMKEPADIPSFYFNRLPSVVRLRKLLDR